MASSGFARGSINSSIIPAEETDLDVDIAARTFGEATIDIGGLLDELGLGQECLNYGSVYLKSRSSNSFTSSLKDFIKPRDVQFSNCATITIQKVDGDGIDLLEAGIEFSLFEDNSPYGDEPGSEDGTTAITTCLTNVLGVCTMSGVYPGHYWVVETENVCARGICTGRSCACIHRRSG